MPTYNINKQKYKDIESANWHHLTETNFVVTTESGHFLGFDTRQLTEPIFSVKAHAGGCTSASFSQHIQSMLVTVGTD